MQTPLVAILLCTYQGERFLRKQLASIAAQTYQNWQLFVSDDHSSDQTLAILKDYATEWEKIGKKLVIFKGPQKGFAANFFSLMQNNTIQADLYALSDQDDIWDQDKLQRAGFALQPYHTQPALYCSRTQLINENDEVIGLTTLYTKPPCFNNALVQNIAGGNTMVFNHRARQIITETPAHLTLPFHDWWIYLLVTACEGKIIYDAYPTVHYRQHASNQIGANQSYFALLLRLRLLLKGTFSQWNKQNLQALLLMTKWLTPRNQVLLKQYCKIRQASFWPRLLGFIKARLFRQTFSGNIKLLGAVLLKKI